MVDHGWKHSLSYGDRALEFVWAQKFARGRSVGYWGYVVDPETGEPIRGSIPEDAEAALNAEARSARHSEIRAELPEGYLSDLQLLKDTISSLFERSAEGEFLGQFLGNDLIYVSDIAEIFGVELFAVFPAIQELVSEGRIGLNGMILIPAEDYQAAFASWERATDHRRLTMGDFGWWSCEACGKHGDDYDNPKDFPCEPPAAPEFPAIALPGTEPEIISGVPGDGCSCICHQIVGISHIRACCDGSSAVVVTETRIKIEAEGTQQP